MDSMEIDDDIYIDKNLTMQGLITQDFQRRKQPSRCVTVCLGLLCAVLLAGNIGQIIYYKISRPASADPTQANYNTQTDRLQSGYDALTAERKQFEARLSNLTKEKDQLQQSYNTLKQESDQLQTSYNDTQRYLEGLQTNHNNLTESKDQLQTNYSNLQTLFITLMANRDQLQTNYSNLQRENGELQTSFITLMANRDQLQSNYSSLKMDKESIFELQRSCNTLNISKNNLQISYNSLWKEKEQLQTRYNTLRREKEQLQTTYSSLATGKDQVQKRLDKMVVKIRGMLCQTGWRKFDVSCYFVSTVKKDWMSSRQACIAKGADLVIINGRSEQIFVHGLLTSDQNVWIGLTDSLEEGTWTWVDGTPVTTSYWQPGQPNSYNGNQDCGEMVHTSSGQVGEWNDDGCHAEQIWICEK